MDWEVNYLLVPRTEAFGECKLEIDLEIYYLLVPRTELFGKCKWRIEILSGKLLSAQKMLGSKAAGWQAGRLIQIVEPSITFSNIPLLIICQLTDSRETLASQQNLGIKPMPIKKRFYLYKGRGAFFISCCMPNQKFLIQKLVGITDMWRWAERVNGVDHITFFSKLYLQWRSLKPQYLG